MAFTVAHQGGTKDLDFSPYLLLLLRRGVDLTKLKRTPEPGTNRRWLYVWERKADAEAFADELRERTEDAAWEVTKTSALPSEGPLGPVEIQVVPFDDGWNFILNRFSKDMIRKSFPEARLRHSVTVRTGTRPGFRTTQHEVPALAESIVRILTGLSLDQFTETFGGYRFFDPDSKREVTASAAVHS
jgi:hypothetical protein